jgi:hypothetical protein
MQRSLIESVSCPRHDVEDYRCFLCVTARDINNRLSYERYITENADSGASTRISQNAENRENA